MQTIENQERIKSAIAHEVSRCGYDAMGNGHAGVEVSVLADLVIVRVLRGVPPPAEQRFAGMECQLAVSMGGDESVAREKDHRPRFLFHA